MAINRNYNMQQLYEELKFRYPGLSQTTLLETMKKHSNHRDRCIEDLNLLFMSEYRSHSSHNQFAIPNHYNQNNYGFGPTQTPSTNSMAPTLNPNGTPVNLNATPHNLNTPLPAGPPPTYRQAVSNSRSHSVSGAPGGDVTTNSYGFKYANDPIQCPQSAPVTSGHYSPFIASRVNYYGSEREFPFASGPPKPPKPPVPPPTYRSHLEQHGGGSGSGSYPSLYPSVPSFPKNVSSPPVRHKTSLNFVPINPNRLRGGSGYDPWVGQSYGWNQGASNLHLSPGNAAPPSTPSYGAAGRVAPPLPPPSLSPSQPYQSLLHISIGPNGTGGGGGLSVAPRHNPQSPSTAPSLQIQYPNDSVSPSGVGGAQASPRVSPSDLYQRSLFDRDDPEQERISQRPMRPQPSPTNIGGNQIVPPAPSTSRGASPCWPYTHPSDPQAAGDVAYNEEAYSQALISHQKEQVTILQREHFRESLLLQEVRREVAKMEEDLFRRRTQFHDQVFPTVDDIQRLWSEIRSYSVDCSCMTRVVDLLHNGQVPLGETNEDFYKSINTGQQDPVLPPTSLRRGISSEDRSGNVYDQRSSPLPWSHPPLPSASSSSEDRSDRGNEGEEEDDESQKWSCSACTFLNSLTLERCNMCEMPRVILGVGVGGQRHKVCIHVRQNASCSVANKGLQLKLTHKLGAVKR